MSKEATVLCGMINKRSDIHMAHGFDAESVEYVDAQGTQCGQEGGTPDASYPALSLARRVFCRFI